MRRMIAIAFCLLVLGAPAAVAQEFRVETDVFLGDEKIPSSQYLTIFAHGFVYDFPLNEAHKHKGTIYDVSHNRVVLLDSERRIKYQLTVPEIHQFIAAMEAKFAAPGVDPEILKLANPDLVEQFDAPSKTLTLAGERIIYKAKGIEPKFPIAARLYRDFADWAARLNATYPQGAPPFARMKLNAALQDKGLAPETVERIVLDEKGRQVDVAHTRHLFNWILSNTDRQRIVEVENYLTGFRTVERQEYFAK